MSEGIYWLAVKEDVSTVLNGLTTVFAFPICSCDLDVFHLTFIPHCAGGYMFPYFLFFITKLVYSSLNNVDVEFLGVATEGSVAIDIVGSVSGNHVETC